MFRIVPLSIIGSFSLYTQLWYMSYRFADSLRAGSGRHCSSVLILLQAVSKPVWHIPLLCVQWKTPDDGQRNYPKHVEFYSKNKFEKLVHLVGFIIIVLQSVIPVWFWASFAVSCKCSWHAPYLESFLYLLRLLGNNRNSAAGKHISCSALYKMNVV